MLLKPIISYKIKKLCLILGLVLNIVSQAVLAENDLPLLMENKKNLHQRILTIPEAELFPQAKHIQRNAVQLPVFSVYYVYARIIDEYNEKWVQVGLDRRGNKVGWIKENKTIDWSQRLTLTFRDLDDGQDRTLLFKDKASAEALATNSNLKQYQKIYQAAVNGETLENSPAVAIQPSEKIDIRDNFYLIPIHSYEEIFIKDTTARLLEVSSIPLREEIKKISTKSPSKKVVDTQFETNKNTNSDYAAGITFVIDSTLSMQPYIDRTRKAVRKIFNDINKADLLGNVNFGLVAYRDNTNVAPNVEYVARQYVNLKQGEKSIKFMRQIAGLEATEWSTKGFIEDGYAGVYEAIKGMEWSPFAARYIVLITDAGSREASDPLSKTGLDANKLRKIAQEKNIAIFVLHLLTPAGKINHRDAEIQYKALSDYPGIGSFYYGVPTGDLNEFGRVIETLSTQITAQVGAMKKEPEKDDIIEAKQDKSQLQDLSSKVERLGYALRMRYLQKNKKGEHAPSVFKAWLIDKNFKDPEKRTVDVRVLLTRNQLSDLHIVLKQVLDTAEKGVISPKNFLNELKSLAATTSRNPELLGGTTATTAGEGQSLAEMGFMREYIDGLPYTGEVMNLSLDEWESWSVKRQISFLQSLEDKINYYQTLHHNVDQWVSLKDGPIDGDSVFPIPLEMLP